MKRKLLFVCVHNSARSQIAEAYMNLYGNEYFEAESAGFEPTDINPLAIEVMKEEGIDISDKKTKSVFDLFKSGRFFGYIITVCSRGREAECPVFPGIKKRIHWELDNPEDFEGTYEEKLEKTRIIRDRIKTLVLELIQSER